MNTVEEVRAMKLPKAKEILTDIKDEDPELYRDDEQTALKLGIEAINFKEAWQKGQYFPPGYLLPGETKD
jgi:hypothetical protein